MSIIKNSDIKLQVFSIRNLMLEWSITNNKKKHFYLSFYSMYK